MFIRRCRQMLKPFDHVPRYVGSGHWKSTSQPHLGIYPNAGGAVACTQASECTAGILHLLNHAQDPTNAAMRCSSCSRRRPSRSVPDVRCNGPGVGLARFFTYLRSISISISPSAASISTARCVSRSANSFVHNQTTRVLQGFSSVDCSAYVWLVSTEMQGLLARVFKGVQGSCPTHGSSQHENTSPSESVSVQGTEGGDQDHKNA